MQRYGLRPWEINELTLTEISVYLDSDEQEKKMGHSEAHAVWERQQNLSPMERLQYGG